jgi:hypothetical protein
MAKKRKTTQGPIYTWSGNFQAFKDSAKADPQVIGETLEAIGRQHKGQLRPRYIWEAARASPRHPLHRHFEWNVQKAAEQNWDDVARRLTRSIMILPIDAESNQPPRRAWLSVPGEGYQTVAKVMDEAAMQYKVMRSALAELEGFIDRYNSLDSVCGSALKTARSQLAARLAASAPAGSTV